MEKFVVNGGNKLRGNVKVSGSKNVALKALVAACLTDEKVVIKNIPHISDFYVMVEILKELGGKVEIVDHEAHIQVEKISNHEIPLDKASLARTSVMFISPLLVRVNEAIIPNPGGCRLGARPVDRLIDSVEHLGAKITYHSEDGYFHAKTKGLLATDYTFSKNTHTGTESFILAAVLAKGTTTLKNAAEEPEIDDLIELLNLMGAKIKRTNKREITIIGVDKLHGCEFVISPDRNEVVTFALAAFLTKGDIFVEGARGKDVKEFLQELDKSNCGYEEKDGGMRFFYKGEIKPTRITTKIYPGFMTDWQAPWAVLMTQADGSSFIHETVFENKFGYISDLKKMGAKIEVVKPKIDNPEEIYNFNLEDDNEEFIHAIEIHGPTPLHNAVVTTVDIRAGAAIVLAALVANGESTIFGIEKLDRGYEDFENRLKSLGADIKRVREEIV
ncbi:MAG TPA: UDP-N-acetylglucosamine 1-carboxyvinyltransferase [Patescibacteria group bacterium]